MNQPLFTNVIQVGLVVRCAATTARRYQELLGLSDWHFNEVDTESGKGANFRSANKPIVARANIAWIQLGNVELELIEPRDEHSVYAQFLRENGPGIHHVMFATADYDVCVNRIQANAIPVLGSGELQHTRFQLFDTEADLGMICEIADGDPLLPDHSGLD
jgi:methylmalonyl-CoA/ethylmalonyl-CoA epimerase